MPKTQIKDGEDFDQFEVLEAFVGQSHLVCVDHLSNADREVFELKVYKLPDGYYSFTQTSSFTTETPIMAPCGRRIGTAVRHDLGKLKKVVHYDDLNECLEKASRIMAKKMIARVMVGI